MKKSKIIYILLILLSTCFLTSCKVKEIEDSSKFIDLVYSWSSGKLEKLIYLFFPSKKLLIDLRELKNNATIDDYDSGHISGALSYDYGNLNKEKFTTWITGLYSKKATILLIDSGHEEYKVISEYLKEVGYKKIIAYTLGYQELKKAKEFNQKLVESTGVEDCGC